VTSRPEYVFVSLAPGVSVSPVGPGSLTLERPPYRIVLKLLDEGTAAALLRLAGGPVGRAELDRIATQVVPAADLDRLETELGRLAGKLMLQYRCVVDGTELLRAAPTSELARFDFPAGLPAAWARLSRFAYLHRSGDDVVLESPTSYARAILSSPALGALVAALAVPQDLRAVDKLVPGEDPVAVRAAAAFLIGAGIVAEADADGATAEDRSPWAQQREFHDVVAHAGSRAGLTDRPVGATLRFRGAITPEPAVKKPAPGRRISLPRPDMRQLAVSDPPLAQVMEARCSLRRHGETPITLDQLGEFLYRVARVRAVRAVDEGSGRYYESSSRTYPSGGAVYDIELYVTVRCCAGLDPGIYHYDASCHRLALVSDQMDPVRRILLAAYVGSGRVSEPHTVITLASRFTRISWKYEAIAYSLTLKNVGVLYEAMYLAATAMRLAGCGLGAGDSSVFSQVTGLDPLIESSVGEFMLGAPPEIGRQPASDAARDRR
jgi:SagB-type dehydrogenase family enzyme